MFQDYNKNILDNRRFVGQLGPAGSLLRRGNHGVSCIFVLGA